ncbi:CHAT domain-containing protein [Winogradskyella aquimaris]|uniref:CHAT domain-containing protein n=1 Tax=Winogradskyella aquimaris TaxID=864074 RepID=A0ABU5ES02_9FLAO|nr:CHAT domain-containing protein [Winogradskyella aquimaris]MDY2588335.1 CHAT domain-containing protein [Winogradskyella aquimaris]
MITQKVFCVIVNLTCFVSSLSLFSQDVSELIQLHRQNLKELYETRGAPPDWLETGHVDDQYLEWCLDHYSKPTAILLYTHQEDTLTINLFDKKATKLQTKIPIKAKELVDHINNVNLYYSKGRKDKSPKLRGSKSISKKNRQLKTSLKTINTRLLPDTFDLENYEHIIIVPVFNISTLPFSAFKIRDKELIDIMSYSIAPSLFELMVSNKLNNDDYYYKKQQYNWENALFVANPEYPNDSIWNFPDLPGTIREVNTITKDFPKDSQTKLIGKEATKKNVLDSICNYDLIYFATHGISNSENPLENSFLVLSESDDDSAYFSLSEIMNIRKECSLKADLVVLSACQTGLGKSHEGGIIGLARSFQIAGANHVVMSLWNIDDEKTATFMSFFFEELRKSNDLMPHEALRQATLRFKSEIDNDPKYWAAFSIFGVPY